MKVVKQFFCNHDYLWVRNIYGDEINEVSLSKVYRSWWKCNKCEKIIAKEELVTNGRKSSE